VKEEKRSQAQEKRKDYAFIWGKVTKKKKDGGGGGENCIGKGRVRRPGVNKRGGEEAKRGLSDCISPALEGRRKEKNKRKR